MGSSPSVLIYFIIEKHIEENTLLLAKSIRRFSDSDKKYSLIAFNPRKSRLSKSVICDLERLNVQLNHINLNRHFDFYPLSNKVFVSSYVEEHYSSEFDILMFLDSDTLVLKPLDSLFNRSFKVAIKPESDNIVGLRVQQDPDLFWQILYENANLESSCAWSVTTSIDNVEIKAYYNSGVIVTKGSAGIFQTWKDFFLSTITDRRSFQIDYVKYYFIEQASLSMAIVKNINNTDVISLNNNFNFPLHLYDKISKPYDFSSIYILHYHELLLSADWIDHFNIEPHTLQWILDNKPNNKRSVHLISRIRNILKFQVYKMRYKYHLLPQLGF